MKTTYYIFNPGRLSRRDNTIMFVPVDDEGAELTPKYLPVEGIEELYSFGSLDANSALYNFLGQKNIPLHFFDYYENYTGSYMPRDSLLSGKMLLAQVNKYQNKSQRLNIARKFIEGASFNMVKNLKYYNNRGKDLQPFILEIEALREKLSSMPGIEALMGIEGNIRIIYYQAYNLMLDHFELGCRTKQPPENEVNALISFGNMICYCQCLKAIHQTQLNPVISFLHSPSERRYSLSLDISEIFKPILVDRVIFRLVNRKEIRENHFEKKLNKCLLNEAGKKIYVKAIEERLNETIHHRSLKRKVSHKHLIKLECYKLAKHFLDIEEYKPFQAWW